MHIAFPSHQLAVPELWLLIVGNAGSFNCTLYAAVSQKEHTPRFSMYSAVTGPCQRNRGESLSPDSRDVLSHCFAWGAVGSSY